MPTNISINTNTFAIFVFCVDVLIRELWRSIGDGIVFNDKIDAFLAKVKYNYFISKIDVHS